jgi:ribosomal protein L17
MSATDRPTRNQFDLISRKRERTTAMHIKIFSNSTNNDVNVNTIVTGIIKSNEYEQDVDELLPSAIQNIVQSNSKYK